MNSLLTKTILPQFLNKNIAFRTIFSTPFSAVSEKNRNRITTNRPTAFHRCQQNAVLGASTMSHDKSPTQIDFIRSFSSNTVVKTSNVGSTLRDKLKKMFGIHKNSKANLNRTANYLYEEVCDNIDYSKFMKQFHMENSFHTWFLINSLHVWMLMVRAMGERENGVFIRNKIVEAMWKDVVLRTKHLGHTNRRLMNKQIWELSKQFEFSLFAYDEGITSDDKQLASTIWTHFFNRNCDDYVQVELMVKYIRANIAMLDNLSSEEFLDRRKFKWSNLVES